CPAQGLRSDGRAAMGHIDGFVRKWGRLLPLFVLGRSRLRPHRSGRHLCTRLSADRRGPALRHPAAPEQDLAHQYDRALMKTDALVAALPEILGDKLEGVTVALGEVTAVVGASGVLEAMRLLRDRSELRFESL